MASCWGFVVALVVLNLGLSEAQNISSTLAIIVNPDSTTPADGGSVVPTTQMGATTAQTVETTAAVVLTTSTLSPCGFYTYLKVSFKSKSGCPVVKDALLKSKFGNFYGNSMFDLKNITFKVKRDECLFNVTFTFGPNITMYNISDVFEDELKRIDNTVGTMVLTNIITHVNVAGVKLGDFKVAAGDCKKICCDGGRPGSPITLYRDCEPSCKCRSYKLNKVEPNCMDICPKVCSGVTMCMISFLVLLFGVFMNWFLK